MILWWGGKIYRVVGRISPPPGGREDIQGSPGLSFPRGDDIQGGKINWYTGIHSHLP